MFWLSLKKKFKNTIKETKELLRYKKELDNKIVEIEDKIQELKLNKQSLKSSTIVSFYKLLDSLYFVGKIIITTNNNIPNIISKFPQCFVKLTNTNMVLKVVDRINNFNKQGDNDLHLSINNLPYKEWILSVSAPRLNRGNDYTVTGNDKIYDLTGNDLNLAPVNTEIFHRFLNKKSWIEDNKTSPIMNNTEISIEKPIGALFFKWSYGERSTDPINKFPANLEVVVYKVVDTISKHINGEVYLEELLNG